jgi:hypothetical protein
MPSGVVRRGSGDIHIAAILYPNIIDSSHTNNEEVGQDVIVIKKENIDVGWPNKRIYIIQRAYEPE